MPYETDFQKINWDNLKREVAQKIDFLRLGWAASQVASSQGSELHGKLVNDIYVPAIRLLAEFCACVEMVDDENE